MAEKICPAPKLDSFRGSLRKKGLLFPQSSGIMLCDAGVLELADEVDSKSIASDGVRVRPPPPALAP